MRALASSGFRAGLFVCSALLVPVLGPASGAPAQEIEGASKLVPKAEATASAERRAPPISFQISVVYANEKVGIVDVDALPIVSRLPIKPGTVSMMEQRSMKVHFGDQGKLTLPTGSEIRLLPVLVHGNQLHLQVEMPPVLNTRLKMLSGRPVILGGIPHMDGFLIVQVLPDFSKYLTGPKPQRPALPQSYRVNKSIPAPIAEADR